MDAHAEQSTKDLSKHIREANEDRKRINGHSDKYVAEHMGVPVDVLFPPEGTTIYIGDPYQRLDRKGVIIVDYEFGPVVEFRKTVEQLMAKLQAQYHRAYPDYDYQYLLKERDQDTEAAFLLEHRDKVIELIEKTKTATLSELSAMSVAFSELRVEVENYFVTHPLPINDDDVTRYQDEVESLWYLAVEGQRATDIVDYEQLVKPKLDKFVQSLDPTLPEEEKTKLIKAQTTSLIEGIRLHKTTKEADVVQAMFPFLPLADNCADSIVAFWSVTTYAFERLTVDDLTSYWREVARLLKVGGKAYLGPLFQSDRVENHIPDGQIDFAKLDFGGAFDISLKIAVDLGLEIEEVDMCDEFPERGRKMLIVHKVEQVVE